MKNIAQIFYDLGLNVFGTINQINEINFQETNLLKSPCNDSQSLDKRRQTLDEFNSIEWNQISGFGIILGFNSLCAIDIDGVIDDKVLDEICTDLKIPKNYPWIFKSGSLCGYHIILECSIPDEIRSISLDYFPFQQAQLSEPHIFGSGDTSAYFPDKDSYGIFHKFYKIEFKWQGNIVLPPSLHPSGNNYTFINEIPCEEPININFDNLKSLKTKWCSYQAKSSTFGGSGMIDGEFYSDISERSSYHLAYSDSLMNNFYAKFREQSVVFHFCQFNITNSPIKQLMLNQISWFIADCNHNIIKRRTFNYYSSKVYDNITHHLIDFALTKKIIDDIRYIYHEFLFDLLHVKEIICWDRELIKILKNEIINSGLYLDAFLKNFSVLDHASLSSIYQDFEYGNDEENRKPIIFICETLDKFKTRILESKMNTYEKEKEFLKVSKFDTKLNTISRENSLLFLAYVYNVYRIVS